MKVATEKLEGEMLKTQRMPFNQIIKAVFTATGQMNAAILLREISIRIEEIAPEISNEINDVLREANTAVREAAASMQDQSRIEIAPASALKPPADG
jgi:hypothetical protein